MAWLMWPKLWLQFIALFQARRLIGDFAIPMAIAIMVVLDIIIKDTYTEVGSRNHLNEGATTPPEENHFSLGQLHTMCVETDLGLIQKLDVPDGFAPTDADKRKWLINPLGNDKNLQVWAIPLAVIPAGLFFILMFMETQVTR